MPHDTGNYQTPHEDKDGLAARQAAKPAKKQTIPGFDFDAVVWREAVKADAGIPAGYTYLAQLMGHDLGKTLPASAVPWSAAQSGEAAEKHRYNLMENPLTLETIYGKGPAGTPGLFHAHNCLFRLEKHAVLALSVRYTPQEAPEPLLADLRNRDTLMLHKLAVVWMQYHNKVARAIMHAEGFDENSHAQRAYFFDVFTRARQIVLKAWHAVILQDLLPTIAHPAAMALSEGELDSVIYLNEIPMLNGVMRAFHALPLARYRLNSGQDSPFGQLRAGKVGERQNWRINWAHFFGAAASNKTGFSASYSRLFTVLSGRLIMEADLKSAIIALPYDQVHAEIINAHALLPAPLKRDLSSQTLEQLFNQKAAELGLSGLPEGAFNQIPLFLLLMLEAQFYGENGSLGPFGSGLLRRFVEGKVASINTGATPGTPSTGVGPHTNIQDIIHFVKNT